MNKQIWLLSGLLAIGIATNSYLLQQKHQQSRAVRHLQQQIAQKRTLIQMASQRSDKPSSLHQRLSMPCSRAQAGEEFQELSTSLGLQRLDFQISPESVVEHTENTLLESQVELKFLNQDDFPLYLMIASLIDEFPGLVMPTEITMWRDGQTSSPQIKGIFKFQWLKPNEEKQG